ncbi:phage holin family protein [Microbacterium sp. 4R-513]|uniref:phage holin family protein n=1 Tax=Microbacterium sp. 4R-513 TaxID=2567934 RepID=UPI0013E1AFF6|nr:phage holin family protein [Microbacterium sp. 4R-513]QIG38668.1 phage holin family protein [Microbacterium sp. 4R-513]
MTDQTPAARRVEPSPAAPLDDSTPSERQAANTSLGELVSQVTGDMSTLMRKELELAKAELRESAKTTAKAGAMLGAAGYAGHMTILFLSITLWWALGYLIGNGWSALIVAVLWGIVAAILFAVGRSNMKKVQGAPQTVETLKEIPETLKRNEENR